MCPWAEWQSTNILAIRPSFLINVGWRETAICRLQSITDDGFPVDSTAPYRSRPALLPGQLAFRRYLIEERQHQRYATIPHQNHIYALDRLLARSSVAPRQAPAFVEQIDRPKLTENVTREALLQYRHPAIEFIVPAGLAAVIDEYAVFGPKLGDCLPSFLCVSLSEHLVEIAFDEGLYRIRHSSLPCIR
jgi:hypothetical protein